MHCNGINMYLKKIHTIGIASYHAGNSMYAQVKIKL